jgi:hypothetical protein
MDKSNRFSLMMEALTEVIEEGQASVKNEPRHSPPVPALPTLKSVLADVSPLPHEALFLGLAEDGLPVLLNLYDPVPGPILIVGDGASGKTNLLQTIARAVDLLHASSAVQYAVITPEADEWKDFHGRQNNAGIYLTKDDNAKELLHALVTWAHNNKGEEQSVLLLIDDLGALMELDEQAQQDLRWLLLRGPSRCVWSFITLNANRAKELEAWMQFFRTRLFGSIQDPREALFVTGNPSHTLDHLAAGTQFAMREDDKLLNFWAPSID